MNPTVAAVKWVGWAAMLYGTFYALPVLRGSLVDGALVVAVLGGWFFLKYFIPTWIVFYLGWWAVDSYTRPYLEEEDRRWALAKGSMAERVRRDRLEKEAWEREMDSWLLADEMKPSTATANAAAESPKDSG